MSYKDLKKTLDYFYNVNNDYDFISLDPVSIPHRFSKKQDREIAGLFAATLAWGHRKSILRNLERLMNLLDNAPHDFVLNHTEKDTKKLTGFAHRTFNDSDVLYFISFMQDYYRNNDSMENVFSSAIKPTDLHVGNGLIQFHKTFFSLDHLKRTEKHISTPLKKSACKRMNLFLRWMVRYDNNGVDFGIWKQIKPSQLLIPLDVHVLKTAKKLNLVNRNQADWQTVLELTDQLRKLDPQDPVKYDFALFGMSINKS